MEDIYSVPGHTLACSTLVTTLTAPSTMPGQQGTPFKTFGSEDASVCYGSSTYTATISTLHL